MTTKRKPIAAPKRTRAPGAGAPNQPPRIVGRNLVVNVAHLTEAERNNAMETIWFVFEIERERRRQIKAQRATP